MLSIVGCSSQEKEPLEDTTVAIAERAVDIDITEMSSTMVFSQIYDMMINPTTYEGKVIRLVGQYQPQYYNVTDTTYQFIVINDATGCCPQGLEFISNNKNENLEEFDIIEIVGVYESYEEGPKTYYRLVTDDVLIQ